MDLHRHGPFLLGPAYSDALNRCRAGQGVGMGKGALTIQLFQKIFVPDYNPTIQDSSLKHTDIDNQCAILDVLDTASRRSSAPPRSSTCAQGTASP